MSDVFDQIHASRQKPKPTHEAGEITAWDSETRLPIVKRKPADSGTAEAKPSNPVEKPEATKPEPVAAAPKPAAKPVLKPAGLSKGDPVELEDGTRGKVAHMVANMNTARVRTEDGRNITVRRNTLKQVEHVQVKAHIRRLPKVSGVE